MKIFRALPALVILLILVLFALSNRGVTRFLFWPTDYALNAPLGLAVLICAAVGFLAGALLVWFGTIAARLRARRAENRVRLLEAQVVELQARLTPRPLPPPGI